MKRSSCAATIFETWKHTPAEERASYLFAAADVMRQRRFIINAWMIYEVGKSWVEADVDTAETIDFLEFYAREAIRLAGKQPIIPFEGEDNQLTYIPLGVGAVIPPWNFPSAIMAGMTCAAFVAGNTRRSQACKYITCRRCTVHAHSGRGRTPSRSG